MNQQEHAELIWYKFGIRAKKLLYDVEQIDLNVQTIKDLQYLQIACATARKKLEEDLAEHLRLFPD